jgi:hypothetical protein
MAAIALMSCAGCGNQTTPSEKVAPPKRATPYPTPTRSVAGGPLADADMALMLPEYNLSRSGAYWIQLDHRETDETTIVVGMEPGAQSSNLQAHVDDHREAIHYPPVNEHLDSGFIESEILGQVAWSWGRLGGDAGSTDEIALFCHHSALVSLMIARYEFPSDGGDLQPRLDELVRVAEIVSKGL